MPLGLLLVGLQIICAMIELYFLKFTTLLLKIVVLPFLMEAHYKLNIKDLFNLEHISDWIMCFMFHILNSILSQYLCCVKTWNVQCHFLILLVTSKSLHRNNRCFLVITKMGYIAWMGHIFSLLQAVLMMLLLLVTIYLPPLVCLLWNKPNYGI